MFSPPPDVGKSASLADSPNAIASAAEAPLRSPKSSPLHFDATSIKALFSLLVLIGFGLRIGYGVIRYRSRLVHLSGQSFVASWDHDALIHVLIAKALLAGKGYVVDDSPLPAGKDVHYRGQDAVFKAPFYEFFLAGVFAISGLSFKLYFPLQALLGGLTSGFVGLIAWKVFRNSAAAWLAGLAAAAHPILVNSASQPYNENLFYFLYTAAILVFVIWIQTPASKWALLCGALAGMCILTRENGSLLLAAMAGAVFISARHRAKMWGGCALVFLAALVVVAPWTIRNYVQLGVFLPVSSITGTDLKEGNTPCIASESLFTPYWAEGPCPAVEEQVRAEVESAQSIAHIPAAVLHDRASWRVAAQFIGAHPGKYAKLSFRRFWATLFPYDPRGHQHFGERVVLSLYWILIFPAGLWEMIRYFRRSETEKALLVVLILLNLMAITAVLYWSDLRFRVGIDLLLGVFAAWAYAKLFQSEPSSRAYPDVSLHNNDLKRSRAAA